MNAMAGKEGFLAQYERIRGAEGNGRSWLAPIRKAAIERFERLGLPSARDEQWRQTSLAPLAKTAFGPAPEAKLDEARTARLREFLFDLEGEIRLVFVNGRLCEPLCLGLGEPGEAKAGSLAKALAAEGGSARAALESAGGEGEDALASLNTALFEDGAFVSIPEGAAPPRPIHIVYAMAGEGEPAAAFPRTLILAGARSQSTILESYVGLGGGAYFTNAVTEILAGDEAILDHYKIEEESPEAIHVSALRTRQGRGARLANHAILVGGRLARNNITAILDGEGGDCILNGVYLPTGTQHIDSHTKIEHAQPHCHSRETYKGILDGEASGVFNGYIHVHPGAQKTDAVQSNRALLLSEGATVHTQPQLEIYADDVKCTHGATIGQLDEEAIFYLRSRGIDEAGARGLLTYAFANEIIDEIKVEPVRERLEGILATRFRGSDSAEGAARRG